MADLLVACMRDGNFKYLKSFIDRQHSINDYVYEDDENRLNLLHLASGLNSEYREEVIELLIKNRADLNYPGKCENTEGTRALHLAAMWGNDVTVKQLLYYGADASLRDSDGMSPIDYASIYDNYLCISLLLRYGSLNSTAAAWSAIMDSSLGDSNADSSLDGCLYTTALDFGGDDDKSIRHDRAISPSPDDGEYDPLDEIRDDQIDLGMDNHKLRMELKRLGREPGPITGTTKKLYAKLLVHLTRQDKELVYSPHTKAKSLLNGYSVELNSIITGRFPIKQSLDLEKEFVRLSGTKAYHGPKQFFNYILIDPRISRNLPEQAIEASDSETSGNQLSPDASDPRHAMARVNRKFDPKLFTKFIESIFYIGKGQKKRDLMHLYDALADRGSITQSKIDKIRSIWSDDCGVVSLHIFHNITDKEALTREALMIETIGLENLSNVIKGTIQFKLGWSEHKRKLLGSLLLHRAYLQLLNEGERQLRMDDLKLDSRK